MILGRIATYFENRFLARGMRDFVYEALTNKAVSSSAQKALAQPVIDVLEHSAPAYHKFLESRTIPVTTSPNLIQQFTQDLKASLRARLKINDLKRQEELFQAHKLCTSSMPNELKENIQKRILGQFDPDHLWFAFRNPETVQFAKAQLEKTIADIFKTCPQKLNIRRLRKFLNYVNKNPNILVKKLYEHNGNNSFVYKTFLKVLNSYQSGVLLSNQKRFIESPTIQSMTSRQFKAWKYDLFDVLSKKIAKLKTIYRNGKLDFLNPAKEVKVGEGTNYFNQFIQWITGGMVKVRLV